MIRVRVFVIATVATGFLAAAPCAAAPADTSATLYPLITPPSSLQVGCQGPCECVITTIPTYGSFELVRTGDDPLYTHYDVRRYIASFNNGPGAVAITGSGQYKIGGEFALVQQMTLDLDIQGQPTQHFDSGLVPVTVAFPQIHIACAVHGFWCDDSVLVVDAGLSEVTGLSPPIRVAAGLQSVRPNPFTSRATIAFSVDQPSRVDLTVVDLGGRRVAALASGVFVATGPQSVSWNGKRDDGRAAPAGVYWVVLRGSGVVDRLRFVKLD